MGRGVSFSPKLVPRAQPPMIKNGTSEPSFAASERSFLVERFVLQSLLSPFKTAAASEEAPPRPDEIGIFL